MYICFLFSKYPFSLLALQESRRNALFVVLLSSRVCLRVEDFLEQRVAVGKLLGQHQGDQTDHGTSPVGQFRFRSERTQGVARRGDSVRTGLLQHRRQRGGQDDDGAKRRQEQTGARVRDRIRNAVSQRKRSRGEHLSPQRLVLGDFGVQSSHPADLRDAAVDHLDRGRVREHLHGVVEELRVVPERRGFGDGTIRGVAVL